MSFLLDTNLISEVRKGRGCDPGVAAWWAEVDEDRLRLSALVLGEIRKGIDLLRRRDPERAQALDDWLAELRAGFAERILPIDAAVAEIWGGMSALRRAPVIDRLLAATAKANGLTLVTRNAADVAGLDVDILNPVTPTPGG
ncbi:MAG: type II toxin-antitoxin system VapC family toxin [Alphaproteobacteria bacterium]